MKWSWFGLCSVIDPLDFTLIYYKQHFWRARYVVSEQITEAWQKNERLKSEYLLYLNPEHHGKQLMMPVWLQATNPFPTMHGSESMLWTLSATLLMLGYRMCTMSDDLCPYSLWHSDVCGV